jgi:glycosyltransferase involved in cell wall biosynthesis
MKKILYVVHRYYPYPGGSEYYVKNMAEETLKRGHEVWVYTHMHEGDQNGIKVTSDINILLESFDLIIVHGDSSAQNIVLTNITKIPSRVLYMIIKPTLNYSTLKGLQDAKFISYSTEFDKKFIKDLGFNKKLVYIPHGIPLDHLGVPGFKDKYGIKGKMILSCGGFWKHKGHNELAEIFSTLHTDFTLVMTGYWNDASYRPKDGLNIKTLILEDMKEPLNAISEADLYIMNSYEEGFGLVLLEAMLNRTPWASRPVGKAPELTEYGHLYENISQLKDIILNKHKNINLENSYNYIIKNHSIRLTVDNILNCI